MLSDFTFEVLFIVVLQILSKRVWLAELGLLYGPKIDNFSRFDWPILVLAERWFDGVPNFGKHRLLFSFGSSSYYLSLV